jgi:hypothetical protein
LKKVVQTNWRLNEDRFGNENVNIFFIIQISSSKKAQKKGMLKTKICLKNKINIFAKWTEKLRFYVDVKEFSVT